MKHNPRFSPAKKLLTLLLTSLLILSGNLLPALGAEEPESPPAAASSMAPESTPGTELSPAPSPSPAPEELENSEVSGSPLPTVEPDVSESPAPSELPEGSPSPEASPSVSSEPTAAPVPAPTSPAASPEASPTPLPTEAPQIGPSPAPSLPPVPSQAAEQVVQAALLGILPRDASGGSMSNFITAGGGLYQYVDGVKTLLKNNDVVSKSAPLLLRYYFNISEEAARDKIGDSGTLQFPVPNATYLQWTGSGRTYPLYIDGHDSEPDYLFATLHVASDTSAYVTFAADFATNDIFGGGIEQGWLELNCQLDGDQVGDDKEQIQIVLANSDFFTLNILENQRKNPTVQKRGSYNPNTYRFEWTVEYTPGNKIEGPLTLVDTFSPEKQTYVPDSFRMDGASVAAVSDPAVASLTYEIPEPKASASHTFTYETGLSDAALSKGGSVTADNTAVIENAAGEELASSGVITATAGANQMAWITKTGTPPADTAEGKRTIAWKVVLNTLDRNLSGLTLEDNFDTGLTLLPDTLKINGQAYLAAGFTLTDTGAAFRLGFPDSLDPSVTLYTITYETKIDDSLYDRGETPSLKNEAVWNFTWNPYGQTGGDPIVHIDPVIGVAVPVNAALLEKTGSYDPSNHRITWTMTVNPHQADFGGGTISDDIPSGQLYVKDTFTSGDGKVSLTSAPEEKTKLTFTVASLGTDRAVFSYQTEVQDPQDYACNTPNEEYLNTASMDATVDGKPQNTVTASGTVNVSSNVLDKTCLSYDYSTQKFTWKAEVNRNKMPLENVKLEDTLPAWLEYVSDSVTVGGVSKTDAELGVVFSDQKLTIPLRDINDTVFITFQTKLLPDKNPAFLTNSKISITNKASLVRDKYEPVSSEVTKTIENKVLSKSGTLNVQDDQLSYSVNINPNCLTLSEEMDNNKVVDTLPEGVRVDLDTVLLREAAVSSNGSSFTPGEAASDSTVSYDAAQRQMTVTLPDAAQPYVLTYNADVLDPSKTSFTNSIAFLGSKMSGGAGNDSESVGGGGGGGGGGLAKRKGSLKIVKTDAELPSAPVPGAGFSLYDTRDLTTVLDTGVTDENGELTFLGLSLGQTYKVMEQSPAVGYVPPETNSWEVTVTESTASHGGPYLLELSNRRVTGDLSFRKENDWGRPLSGAVFQLKNKDVTLALERSVESGEDGSVLFKDVPYGEYTLVETAAPANHQLDSTVYDVSVDAAGTVTLTKPGSATGIQTVVNLSDKASIRIEKTNSATKEPMKDVEFTVTDSKGIVRGGPRATDDAGIVTFDNLMVGETYTVRETRPSGFQAAPDQTVTLSAKGDTTMLSWENTPLPPTLPLASIAITKVDISTGKPMSGVFFEVFDAGGVSWGRGQTDENGLLVLEGLPTGSTYTIHETTPEGYLDVPDQKLELTEEKEYAVRWENTPAETPSPSPSPSNKPGPTPKPDEGGNTQNGGSQGTNTSKGNETQTSSGKKLPQTGRNQALPLLTLGAGVLLAGAGCAILRRKKNRHEK